MLGGWDPVFPSNHEYLLTSLSAEKQTTKFTSVNFQKKIKSKPQHIENLKTRGQTV